MLAALSLCLSLQSSTTVELYRGAEIAGLETPYWAVEDTTLDPINPEEPMGGSSILTSGPGKSVLIQFLDLKRTLGSSKRIKKAALKLAVTGGKDIKLDGVFMMKAPWTEGPINTLSSKVRSEDPNFNRWAATWRHRRFDNQTIPWGQAGATSGDDVEPIADVKLTELPDGFIQIDGLEKAVQRQYDNWSDNHGFALRFAGEVEFLSSNASEARPKLTLEMDTVADDPASQADLSVTLIERSPEFQRYDDRNAYTYLEQHGQSIGLMDKVPNGTEKKWPFEGEEQTYTAHIKNVGQAPATGFTSTWLVREKASGSFNYEGTLQPGQETTVTIKLPFRTIQSDHRVLPLALKVVSKSPDRNPENNFLEIQQNGLNLAFYIEQDAYDGFNKQHGSFEDWLQSQLRTLNEVYFRYSRFSFAPQGVVERLRIQKIQVVPNGGLAGSNLTPGGAVNLNYDGELGFKTAPAGGSQADLNLFRRILVQMGLTDLSVTNLPVGATNLTGKGFTDRFPGLMGGGDTRSDAPLLPTFMMPYDPYFDPVADQSRFEATGLLAMSDVAGLHSNMGRRRGFHGEYLYDQPTNVLVTAMDYNGKALENVDLEFYQMVNGKISEEPRFKVKTGPNGTATLPNQPTLGESQMTTLTAHTLKSNVFGRIDHNGTNGMFLVKAQKNGVSDWTAMKVWQLSDAFRRGQYAIAMWQLRFNVPAQVLELESISKGRPVAGGQLSGLTDGSMDAQVPVSGVDYFDIDLGKERTVGEVRLLTREPQFWQTFEIRVNPSGADRNSGVLWSRELDWNWSISNRRDLRGELRVMPYRGNPVKAKTIRIWNTSKEKVGSLAEVEVIPVRGG